MPNRRKFFALSAAAVLAAAVVTERKWKTAEDPVLPEHLRLPDGKPLAVHTDDGAVLAATVAGEGPTVVLAHGFTNGRAVWSPVAHRLIESGHQVVLYDQRGHGDSTVGADGYTIARLGSDLRAVLEAADAHDAVVVGHSMGGMTIQAFAAGHPDALADRVRAVVLVSTTSHGLANPRMQRGAQAVLGGTQVDRIMRSRAGHAAMRGVVGRNVRYGHLTLARDLFVGTPPETRVGFFNAMQDMDLREGLASLTVPASVLVGTRDRLTPPVLGQALADALNVPLTKFPDAGHMLPLEHPDEVARHIADQTSSSRSNGAQARATTWTRHAGGMVDPGKPRVVGVVAPMPSELKPFAKAVGLTARSDDRRLREGTIGGTRVVATLSGMGTAGAAAAAERLLDAGADHVVVMGIAGGLVASVPIGEVLVPEVVIDGDAGGEYRPVPLGNNTPAGRLCTSNNFTSDPAHIAKLVADGVVAVDMETAAVGIVCGKRGVPWSVFRSISDKPSDGMVDESLFALANPDGSPNLAASARYVLRRPWKIPMLLRVARDAGIATRAAADATITAIRTS